MEGDKRTRHNPVVPMVSPSKNSDSLQSYLSRISIPNTPSHPSSQQRGYFGASNYQGMAESEVNFNNQSMVNATQTKLAGGVKMYEDKRIPGAKSELSYPVQGPMMTPGLVSSMPSYCSSENNNRQHMDPLPFISDSSCVQNQPTRILREVGQNSLPLASQTDAQVAMSIKPSFSYQELVTATEGFSDKNILGEGGFGVVYYGQLRHLDCAVKRFIKQRSGDSTEQINTELAALFKYQHENIVTLYGYALDGPQLCLVYQYLNNGSLEDRLMRKNNTPSLSWERRLNVLVGSCRAISFLHTMGTPPLIHGDIKSANILLDSHFEAKFADLGQSRYATITTTGTSTSASARTHITVDQTTTRQYGSTAYQAPEIKSCCRMSTQSDIYAMGVVILEVCSGLVAYDYNRNENKFITDLYQDHFAKMNESDRVKEFQDKTPPDYIHPSAFLSILKLASQCISEIKKARPSSGKLLRTMKKIYDDQYKEQSYPKSLNSPTEDDVYDMTLSNYHSHVSNRVSSELNSPAPNANPPASPLPSHQHQLPSIVQMQEARLQQLSHQYHHPSIQTPPTTMNSKVPFSVSASKNDNLQTFLPNKTPTPMLKANNQDEKPRVYGHQLSTSSCPEQSPSPSCRPSVPPFHSLSANRNLPESLILQQHYDSQKTSGQIVNQKETSNTDSKTIPSQSLAPVSNKNPVEQGETTKTEGENASTSLASDPSKLAAMKIFDDYLGLHKDVSGSVTSTDISSPATLKCDEAKMAYLKEFDDRVFKCNKGSNKGMSQAGSTGKIDGSGNIGSENNGEASQPPDKGGARVGDEAVSSAEEVCSSCTNPKEFEAFHQQRRDFLPQPGVRPDCDASAQHQTGSDSASCGKTSEPALHSNAAIQINHRKETVGFSCDKGSNADQQRLANRENMFLYYSAGNDDDDDDDDDGENEEKYV